MARAREIMDALADSLQDLPGADQIVGRMNIEPTGTCIDIFPDPNGFEELDERGFGPGNGPAGIPTGALLFVVRARVPTVDYDGSQDILIDWMDPLNPDCVEALLIADDTLGGLASSVDVTATSGYISFVDVNGKSSRLGAQWNVRVLPMTS